MKSELFTSTLTMEANNISCIGTFLSQYTIPQNHFSHKKERWLRNGNRKSGNIVNDVDRNCVVLEHLFLVQEVVGSNHDTTYNVPSKVQGDRL